MMVSPAQSRSPLWPRWPLPLLLGLNLLLRLGVALRPLSAIDGLLIPDDTYLTLTIARNIARGLGPLYGDAFTNGFQPLYAFLTVPFYWIWPTDPVPPVHAALVLLALFDTLALWLLYRYLRLLTHARLGPLLVALFWIFNPYVMLTSLNGLETIIACCCLLGALDFFHRNLWPVARPPRARQCFILGLLLGLAIFARVDSGILAFTLVLILADGWQRRPAALARGLGEVALIALGALLVLLPWLLYSYHYTGDLYPVSGKAARFMALANVEHTPTLTTWYGPMMKLGGGVVLGTNAVALGLIGGLLLLIVATWRGRTPHELRRRLFPVFPVFLFALLLYFAYTLYIFADWYFYRYLFPAILPFLAALAVLIDLAAAGLRSPRARRLLATALATLMIGGQMAQPEFISTFTGSGDGELGYMNVALWARHHFKDGTVIGSSQTGALGYFADNLKVVNLDGVVNKACYHSLVERRNIDYIRASGIQFILGWECNINFIRRHSTSDSHHNLTYIDDVDGLRSWNFAWGLYKVNDEQSARATGTRPAGG